MARKLASSCLAEEGVAQAALEPLDPFLEGTAQLLGKVGVDRDEAAGSWVRTMLWRPARGPVEVGDDVDGRSGRRRGRRGRHVRGAPLPSSSRARGRRGRRGVGTAVRVVILAVGGQVGLSRSWRGIRGWNRLDRVDGTGWFRSCSCHRAGTSAVWVAGQARSPERLPRYKPPRNGSGFAVHPRSPSSPPIPGQAPSRPDAHVRAPPPPPPSKPPRPPPRPCRTGHESCRETRGIPGSGRPTSSIPALPSDRMEVFSVVVDGRRQSAGTPCRVSRIKLADARILNATSDLLL